MRKELELIEKIEAYLQGRLSPAETQTFEEQIAGDPALQAEVELQRQLMTGIDRAGLKEEVLTAKKRYTIRQRILKWGLGGLIVAAVIAALLYYKHIPIFHNATQPDPSGTQQVPNLPILRPADSAAIVSAYVDAHGKKDSMLQPFFLNVSRDTVIETKKGIVLSIPANTFLDEDDRAVTGRVLLVLKEALDPASIMTAGLSTRSGAQPLSTGGMFFVDARQGYHVLHMDTTRPIVVQVPASGDQRDMRLYKGRRLPDSTIDWVDPRPLEHGLVAVDPHLLDFYPPHYLDSLRKWGYNSRDRHFTDSLYYSLAAGFHAAPAQAEAGPKDRIEPQQDTAAPRNDSSRGPYYHPRPCGIDPAKIKTIWAPEFKNTIIATREFEQRLQWLHRAADAGKMLDLYVTHLDWNLSDIDSLVATQSVGEQKEIFGYFARLHDGKVNQSSTQFRQLAEYYTMKARAYAAAIKKTENDYWDRQAYLDSIATGKRVQRTVEAGQRQAKNDGEELMVNLKETYRQLGYKFVPNPPPPAFYTATITSTGWYNIDKAVIEATASRTTLNVTDPATGRRAIIKYAEASFLIPDWKTYDRLYVYLLPDRLSSFMLVSGADGKYTEKLNELLKYDLVCIGYKGDQPWYYHQRNVQARSYAGIRLNSITPEALTRALNKAGSLGQSSDLQKENSFFQFDIKDQKRQQHNRELEALQRRLIAMLFPCWITNQ
ncbi:hypothetical protein Q4E93_20435 [Flavitalea sp. BT771]|uniref:hypothetical protein n=1 Tax=Flavitalea sp. BT771 TaxID=3063329 RepID=UPI0026E167F7|nr:hypothetical protein [Flavitalea sp. BT771]MDO6432988.1 hypothetical protein [Flavitalea sp. BT771]MDV6221736.1 hypothetical protein [Flavitalea sp. BT771]